ncbi:hypothetical protein ANCDUO_15451, partial [Ancylostoma duodenale]
MGISWLWASAQHAQGERGLAAAGACFCCVLVLAYCVSVSHSIGEFSSFLLFIHKLFSVYLWFLNLWEFDYRCISEASTIDGVLEIRSR